MRGRGGNGRQRSGGGWSKEGGVRKIRFSYFNWYREGFEFLGKEFDWEYPPHPAGEVCVLQASAFGGVGKTRV